MNPDDKFLLREMKRSRNRKLELKHETEQERQRNLNAFALGVVVGSVAVLTAAMLSSTKKPETVDVEAKIEEIDNEIS